jgi:hypothetical protein
MARAKLFVKSKKVDIVTGFNPGSYYTRAHSLSKTQFDLPPQDAQAKDFLKKSGVEFDLVDLSKGTRVKIMARLRGVTETPTLLDESSSSRRYVGLTGISRYVSEART